MTLGMRLCSARRRPPTRRAIPTAEIIGRVNDFGGWYQTRTSWTTPNDSQDERPLVVKLLSLARRGTLWYDGSTQTDPSPSVECSSGGMLAPWARQTGSDCFRIPAIWLTLSRRGDTRIQILRLS
jgi:hypothetical protein